MQKGLIWSFGGPPGSLQQAIVVPLAIGAAFLLFGLFPEVFLRDFRLSDFLHGTMPVLALIAVIILLTFMLTMWSMKRRADTGRPPSTAFFRNYAVMYGVGVLIILTCTYQKHALSRDLYARGRSEQARLVRTFTEGCSKHGCTTGIIYAFRPAGSQKIVTGTADEGNAARNDNAEYRYIAASHVVPILYDPAHPSRSMVNWQYSVHRQAGWDYLMFTVLLLIIAIAVPTSVLTFIAWAAMRDFDNRYRSARNML